MNDVAGIISIKNNIYSVFVFVLIFFIPSYVCPPPPLCQTLQFFFWCFYQLSLSIFLACDLFSRFIHDFFSTFFTKALGRPGVKPLIWRACHSRPFLCQKQLNIYQSSSPDSLKWNCPWPLHVPAVDSPGRTTGKRHLPVVTAAPCQSSSSILIGSFSWSLFWAVSSVVASLVLNTTPGRSSKGQQPNWHLAANITLPQSWVSEVRSLPQLITAELVLHFFNSFLSHFWTRSLDTRPVGQ